MVCSTSAVLLCFIIFNRLAEGLDHGDDVLNVCALGSARLGCSGKRLQQHLEESRPPPHDGDGGSEAEADGRDCGAGGHRRTRSQ